MPIKISVIRDKTFNKISCFSWGRECVCPQGHKYTTVMQWYQQVTRLLQWMFSYVNISFKWRREILHCSQCFRCYRELFVDGCMRQQTQDPRVYPTTENFISSSVLAKVVVKTIVFPFIHHDKVKLLKFTNLSPDVCIFCTCWTNMVKTMMQRVIRTFSTIHHFAKMTHYVSRTMWNVAYLLTLCNTQQLHNRTHSCRLVFFLWVQTATSLLRLLQLQ